MHGVERIKITQAPTTTSIIIDTEIIPTSDDVTTETVIGGAFVDKTAYKMNTLCDGCCLHST